MEEVVNMVGPKLLNHNAGLVIVSVGDFFFNLKGGSIFFLLFFLYVYFFLTAQGWIE